MRVSSLNETRPAQRAGFMELVRFFFPLALQAASQSITYPLVAIVASNGEGGPLALAGLAQSNSIMFLMGTLGAGLITTGMVYGKNRQGYSQFVRVNYLIAIIVAAAQAICIIPVSAHWIFSGIIGLPPSIEQYAVKAMIYTIPLQFLFFLRNPFQVCLFLNKATGRASAATVARIVFTLILAPTACSLKLTGVMWAVICLTMGVLLELCISWYFARPYIRKISSDSTPRPSLRELFAFTMPLSIGGLFLSLSGVIIGMVMARADSAERLLPVYYLASGIAGPMAYAATRIQTLTISFPPRDRRDFTIVRFSLVVSFLLGFVPLLLILPGAANWYYVSLQNCPTEDLGLVRITAVSLLLYPLSVGLRAYCEGLAANMRKPMNILAGHGTYMGVLASVSIVFLFLKVPGNVIAPASFFIANLAAGSVIALSIYREREQGIKVESVRNARIFSDVIEPS